MSATPEPGRKRIGLNPMKSLKSAATRGMMKYDEKKEKGTTAGPSILSPRRTVPPSPRKRVPVPRVPKNEKEGENKKKTRKKKGENKRIKERKRELSIRRLTSFHGATNSIKKVLEEDPSYKKKARTQQPNAVYLRLAENLFSAMDLEKEEKDQLLDMIKLTRAMQSQKKAHMCKLPAIAHIEEMARDIAKFGAYQFGNQAALAIQTCFRGFRARKKLKMIKDNWNQPRIDAFVAMIKREKMYVLNLATVISQYVMPLRVSQDKQLKDIAADLKLIFSNLEQIQQVHQSFLDSLYKLGESSWPELSGLGDLFVSISPHWRAYGIYIHNFKFSRDILFECINKSERFSQFLDERTMTLNMDLNMYLSLPLNHIAGYELLVKKLLAESDEGSAAHSSLLQALILTEETANFIANALGTATNVANIERLKRTIVDLPPALFIEISKPSCTFVREEFVEFSVPTDKKPSSGVLVILKTVLLLLSNIKGLQFKHYYELGKVTVESSESNSCAFRIIIVDDQRPKYDNVVEGSEYNFIMDCKEKRDRLVPELCSLVSMNQRTRAFGVDLEHILEREKREIPRVVSDLTEFLLARGLNDLGLFRIPGTSTVVKELRREYNESFVSGVYPNLLKREMFHPNDAAGLLKMFFHDLPQPLIPFQMFSQFLGTQVNAGAKKDKVEQLKPLVDSLPQENYVVLKFLIDFMVQVVANQEINKMGAENMAMCFGPNILRPEEQTIESTLSLPKTNGCVALMILFRDQIFTK